MIVSMTLINLNYFTLWQINFYYSLEYFVISYSFEGVGEVEE